MEGFEKFQASVLGSYREILAGVDPTEIEGQLAKLWTKHKLFGRVFQGFVEIRESYLALRDIETYIGRFPYSGTSIQKARYLRYHIASYLNEMYILRERMKVYATRLGRSYKSSPGVTRGGIELLKKIIIQNLENVVTTRGQHVHDRRYDDRELHELEGWEILLLETDRESRIATMVSTLFHVEYRQARKKWKAMITANNDKVSSLLDTYFEAIYGIVFDAQGRLRPPG